ncbi:Heat shock factor protein 5 [Bagarius yarrelli]|uniref:Heat shock factor protein 5 n=1 Tax=Bagarius yarrelli TaxID=175774 RepID=A0A556VB06_BAGYA|nr:Heat shock factor protein 5 [Bagarius yarrelli]
MEDDKTNSIKHKQFPSKLWYLVNNPEITSICWDSSGDVLLISKEAFEAEILSPDKRQKEEYFKLKDFSSFIRQLNLYGFKKVRGNHDLSSKQPGTIIHFHNPNFKRANPELLFNMKRLTRTNKAKLAAGLEVPSRSKRYQYLMLSSPQKYTAVAKTELPPAPLPQNVNGFQKVEGGDTTSQSLVNGVCNPGSCFCHLLMDAPSAQPSSSMQGSSQCTYKPDQPYTPPLSNYTSTACDCSVSCLHYNDLTPAWGAGDAPDHQSVGILNAETQTEPDSGVQDCSISYLNFHNLTPAWQAADAPDPQSVGIPTAETQTGHDSGVQDGLVCEFLFNDLTPAWQAADTPDPQSDGIPKTN